MYSVQVFTSHVQKLTSAVFQNLKVKNSQFYYSVHDTIMPARYFMTIHFPNSLMSHQLILLQSYTDYQA